MVVYYSDLVKFPRIEFSRINGFLCLKMDADMADYLTVASLEVKDSVPFKKGIL